MHPLAFLVPALLHASVQAPPSSPTIAIVGARIEIGDGRVVENGTIIVRAGRIALVGAGLAAPEGAQVIDGKGLTVYPGFIDAYSTAGLKLPEPLPNVGTAPDTMSTAPATMWAGNRKGIRADVRAAKALDPTAGLAARAAQGVTTVLLSGGTGSIAGTAALVDVAATPTVLVPDAAEEFVLRGGGRFGGMRDEEMGGAQGAPPAPTGNPQGNPPGGPDGAPPTRRGQQPPPTPGAYNYPGTLFGVTALVRQTLYDARTYATEKSPKADATYEGLRPLVTGRMPAMYTLDTARQISRAARLSDEFGFRMIVNGAPDAYRMIDVLKAHDAPVIVSLAIPDDPPRTQGTTADSVPQRVLDDRYALFKERLGNARLLDAAGVTIAFRSGSDDYLVGVRKLVAASGLSREAALKAMTVSPARMFGVSGEVGTIEVGKRANLVLMTGDFLDAKATVRSTLVEGVVASPKPPAASTASKPATVPPAPFKEATL